MSKEPIIRSSGILLNSILLVSVALGVYLFVTSFSNELNDNEKSLRASLAGIIPISALIIQRLFSFLTKRK